MDYNRKLVLYKILWLSLNPAIVGEKSSNINTPSVRHGGFEVNIKQAIQGLFTAGTSDRKEKVGGKRGLK